MVECKECYGRGYFNNYSNFHNQWFNNPEECESCDGEGELHECKNCGEPVKIDTECEKCVATEDKNN